MLAVVRHPFGNIRSLQSWYISKKASDPGRQKVEVLAGLWARAARVYLDNPHTFAAHMRYEDLMARPVETIKLVSAALFSTTGAFGLPIGGEEALLGALEIQVKPAGDYPAFFSETETAVVLDLCGAEMVSLNYSVVDQWTNFSHEEQPAPPTSPAPRVLVPQRMDPRLQFSDLTCYSTVPETAQLSLSLNFRGKNRSLAAERRIQHLHFSGCAGTTVAEFAQQLTPVSSANGNMGCAAHQGSFLRLFLQAGSAVRVLIRTTGAFSSKRPRTP